MAYNPDDITTLDHLKKACNRIKPNPVTYQEVSAMLEEKLGTTFNGGTAYTKETWTFTLTDGTTVDKEVVLCSSALLQQ